MAAVIKSNENSYLLMEIIIIEINKVLLFILSWLLVALIFDPGGLIKLPPIKGSTRHFNIGLRKVEGLIFYSEQNNGNAKLQI